MTKQETAEEQAAVEEYLVKSELELAKAKAIRDRELCGDATLLDLWITLPVAGET